MSASSTGRRIVYVDSDWIPSSGAPAHALVVANGRIFTTDDPDEAERLVSAEDADDVAARVLAGYALRIDGALSSDGPVDVVGEGAVAELVRLVRRAVDSSAERPAAIVYLAPEASGLAEALERLHDLGTLVLASAAETAPSINLYSHLHRRGLRLVGVERPLVSDRWNTDPLHEELTGKARALLAEVGAVDARKPNAGWYRLVED